MFVVSWCERQTDAQKVSVCVRTLLHSRRFGGMGWGGSRGILTPTPAGLAFTRQSMKRRPHRAALQGGARLKPTLIPVSLKLDLLPLNVTVCGGGNASENTTRCHHL